MTPAISFISNTRTKSNKSLPLRPNTSQEQWKTYLIFLIYCASMNSIQCRFCLFVTALQHWLVFNITSFLTSKYFCVVLLLQSLIWGMIYLTAEYSNNKMACGNRILAKRFLFWRHPLPISISKSYPDRADTDMLLCDSNKSEITLPTSPLEFKLCIGVSSMAVMLQHCST